MLNLQKNKGFSLAEMMVVMLMLSIIFAAAAPILTKRTAQTATKPSESLPAGTIVIWSGKISNIPSGWHLCDGTNGTPDLRNRFVVCAGSDTSNITQIDWGTSQEGIKQPMTGFYGIKNTGGLSCIQTSVNEMPVHNHGASSDVQGTHAHPYHFMLPESPWDGDYGVGGAANPCTHRQRYDSNTSAAGAHNHNIYIANSGGSLAQENRPPFYALAYIMKL